MRFFISFLMVVALTGCQIEISSGNDCRRTTDKYSGYRVDVYQRYFSSTRIENGYDSSRGFLKHYTCGPANYRLTSSVERYEYYRHGSPYRGYADLTDIEFSRDSSGQALFKTNTLLQSSNEAWVQDEGRVKGKELTTRRWYKARFSGGVVRSGMVVVSDENSDEVWSEATFVQGNSELAKQKNYNSNTQQYDCAWLENGVVLGADLGCAEEVNFDDIYLNTQVELDGYIGSFQTDKTVSYSVDSDWYYRKLQIR
ncbi:hypothetical protein [Thaumasiovibrio sp. DFM-14]|uniref:hypothetical protein n=1 Tax=Thaumasiovibrio sp. DFM-14 TaxID=3384792 RepID=UPI0039A0C12F